MRASLLASAALLAAPLLLAGCGDRTGGFAPACPNVGILRDAADLTQFRGAGSDITDTVVDARVIGVSGKCLLDDPTHLRTTISVDMGARRGPADRTRTVQLTYFVSVSRGDAILDKRDYTVPITFPANTDAVRLTGDQVDLVLPVNDKLSGAAYSILVGFQLTPQQLAFNRRRGAR